MATLAIITVSLMLTLNSFGNAPPTQASSVEIMEEMGYSQELITVQEIVSEYINQRLSKDWDHRLIRKLCEIVDEKSYPNSPKPIIRRSVANRLARVLKMRPSSHFLPKIIKIEKYENGKEIKPFAKITPLEIVSKYRLNQWTSKFEMARFVMALLNKAKNLNKEMLATDDIQIREKKSNYLKRIPHEILIFSILRNEAIEWRFS